MAVLTAVPQSKGAIPPPRPRLAGARDLAHLPGEWGPPLIGNTLADLRDTRGYTRRMYDSYGPVYRHRLFFRPQVALIGPQANEWFLLDRERVLSSTGGWMPFLAGLFERGLMLLDFDEHRLHRRIMGQAFKTPAMRRYCARMDAAIPGAVERWGRVGSFRFYDAIKRLSLDLATEIFIGLPPGPESERVNRALTDMVQAALALVRLDLPATRFGRGRAGRRFMERFLFPLIERRRAEGTRGDDTLALLVRAEDEQGHRLSDRQIVDHLIFLWMAAHDTITSSVTTLVYELVRHPDWQERLRAEVSALEAEQLTHEDLARLELVEAAFKEALRLNAPVPALPRLTLRDTTFDGHEIPAGTLVGISPTFVHRMEEVWEEPERFDPMRFTEAGGARQRHRFAWVPFGGGAHMCLGLHFAHMQAKLLMFHLLRHWRLEPVRVPYETRFQIMPLTRPRDRLPIRMCRL